MNQSMSAHQLEAWVLSIVDRVRSGQPVEDFRVELKSEWPADANRAARRLAGHGNAARGDLALWLIGVDEKRGVVGASYADLPSWIDPVRKQFDGLPPDLIRDLNVPVDEHTVVALLFATDRAPFVVKSPGNGTVQREVPWRDGTSVRSAKRKDLLRLLSPLQELPSVEVLEVRLACNNPPAAEANDVSRVKRELDGQLAGEADAVNLALWEFKAKLYVAATSTDRIIIPRHRCQIAFSAEPVVSDKPMEVIGLGPLKSPTAYLPGPTGPKRVAPQIQSRTVEASPSEAIVSDAGVVVLHAKEPRKNKSYKSARLNRVVPVAVKVGSC